MTNNVYKFSVFLIAASLFIAGCATTRARKPDPAAEQNTQITQLQQEVQAKDQQIQDLQYQLNNSQGSTSSNYTSSSGSKGGKSSIIHVSGVSVTDLQKALSRAGYDPGPIDGHAGKKTKLAVKQFQRKNKLTADGVVGDKTWALLK